MSIDANLMSLTCSEASKLIHDRKLKPSELIESVLVASEALNDQLRCYGVITGDRALAQARALDALLDAGIDLGPMHGIPVAIKDCIDTAGIPTTMGSQIEKDRVPSEDATLVQRLYRSGAIVVGKTNLYEWCYGGVSTLWGATLNPWDLKYTTGTSSTGSAAAVAAGLAMAAVGSDAGGSVRIPAGLCGIFGLKPTFGRISRSGVWPPSSSLDHFGPMTRDAEGAAIMLEVMAGYDRKDPTTWDAPPPDDYRSHIGRSIQGLRVGVPTRQHGEVLTDDVAAAIDHAIAVLRDAGCQIVNVELPDLMDARTMIWTIHGAEGAELHRPIVREKASLYARNTRKLIAKGEFIPATEYVHCLRVRQVMMNQMVDVFKSVEAIVMPCLPLAPWLNGQTRFELTGVIEDDLSVLSRYCPLFNLTGHPAASVLAGFNVDGLPLSMQIVAPMFGESTILRITSIFEQATRYAERMPDLSMQYAERTPH